MSNLNQTEREQIIDAQKNFLEELQIKCSTEELKNIRFVLDDETKEGFIIAYTKELIKNNI